MRFWYKTIWASEGSGPFTDPSPFTESMTIDIPSTDVLALTFLQQVTQGGIGGTAQTVITSYVEKGDPHSGSWQIMNGNDVSSVTFSLTVEEAYATSTGLILAINE